MKTAVEKHGYQNKSEFARHVVRLLLRVHDVRSEPKEIQIPEDMDNPLAYAGRHGTMIDFMDGRSYGGEKRR